MDGFVCAGRCPVSCGPGTVHCEGIYDGNGCQNDATCEAEPCMYGAYGIDGLRCGVICPHSCGPGETLCPGVQDHNGCKMIDTCEPPRFDDFYQVRGLAGPEASRPAGSCMHSI